MPPASESTCVSSRCGGGLTQRRSNRGGARTANNTAVYSRPRFKDAHLKSTPRFKDDIFFQKQGAPQIYNYHRGVAFLPHGAPKITAVVHLQSCTESGLLLLTLLRAGMERFLPSASDSSAAGLKPFGEPTLQVRVSTCHIGSPVPLRAIHAWVLWSGYNPVVIFRMLTV